MSDERVHLLEGRVAALESALLAKDDAIAVLTHAVADLSRQLKSVEARVIVTNRVSAVTHTPPVAVNTPPVVQPTHSTPPPVSNGTLSRTPSANGHPHGQTTPARPQTARRVSSGELHDEHGSTTPILHRTATFEGSPLVSNAAAARALARSSKQTVETHRKQTYTVGKRKLNVIAPSTFVSSPEDDKAPPCDLELEYVYGFNGRRSRNNAFYLASGECVYNVARLCVVFNESANIQRFFRGHTDEVTCLAVHPNGRYVASAQTAAESNGKKGRPFVCIWDSDTLEVLAQISYHERHISAVAFSACGTRLMTVGGDADHTFAMWSWETEVEVPAMEYPGSKDEIFGIKFSNHSFTEFVTYGVKHLRFWTLKEVPLCVGSKLLKFAVDSRPAFLYEKAALPSAFHCVLYHKDMLLAGTHNGDIMVFTAHHLESVIQAHDTHPVSAIAAMSSGGFVTGGFDGRIKVWTEDMVPVQDVDLRDALGVVGVDRDLNTFKIRSLHTSSDNPSTVLIGTKESQLLALDIEVEVARRLAFNHIGEIACLAVHPTLPHFVTGEANLVRAVKGLKSTVDSNGKQVFDDTVEDTHLLHVWDHAERKPLAFSPIKLKHHAYCMAFSADGTTLAIGHEEGKVSLLNYESQSVIVTKKVTSKDESITCLEWSPDGSCLAVGSVDQCIYLCDPRGNDLRVVRKIVGHTASVLAVSFSADSGTIFSTSRDHELLFWNVESGSRIDGSLCADLDVPHWNTLLGWPVQGIWFHGSDGTDVNSVHIPPSHRAIVTGDDTACVRLYRYPCLSNQNHGTVHHGHAAHVMGVRWTHDDACVVSIGADDVATMQWRVIE